MNSKALSFLLLLMCLRLQAQTDSLKNIDLDEVVVTATRTEKLFSALPMPVTLITKSQIMQMGSLRLNEVLQEQTGLAIVNDHGQGIQMQGFNPDYTLILVDGEPIIGRTAGTLELSRLAVGNIKQIEIVKGPSSSLYGSEALAGVINIITENPINTSGKISFRYGANQTSDIAANFNMQKNKFGMYVFANRYSTGGYDFTPETFGKTVEPYENYTFQHKLNYDFSAKLKFSISGRFFFENQQSNFDIGSSQSSVFVSGIGKVQDFNINPVLDWKILGKWKIQFRLYNSSYQTNSSLYYQTDGRTYDATYFKQNFLRTELQSEYFLSKKHSFIMGLGRIWESVEATRYTSVKRFSTDYLYLQYDFSPDEKWNIVLGGRFDNHSVYGSQLSPKLSIQYDIMPQIAVRVSAGMGFKAPDFRQLYLNFTNAVAGYSVFGSEEIPEILAQLQAQNQIENVSLDPSLIGKLSAEKSMSFNFGFKIKPIAKIFRNINFFRNDIENLIESQVVATRTNGQNIFSYRNLNKIYTQGFETDFTYQRSKSLSFSAGYQYLEAKDKDILQKLENGEIFKRDPLTLVTTRLVKSDYGGLMGRSRSMMNFKIFYQNKKTGISSNLRAIYRGKYGLADRNGNLILDEANEYVLGFWTFNLSASKEFLKQKLRIQFGLDNIFDYRDQLNMPNIAGRLWWGSLNFQINQQ